jgi:hypothetical protein
MFMHSETEQERGSSRILIGNFRVLK